MYINSDSINYQSLSKEEILYLHLKENHFQRNKFVVSESITEQGICEILGCDRSYASRLLNKNIKEGNIYRKKIRIKNKNRIQSAFFLTEKGYQIAIEIEKNNKNKKFVNKGFGHI